VPGASVRLSAVTEDHVSFWLTYKFDHFKLFNNRIIVKEMRRRLRSSQKITLFSRENKYSAVFVVWLAVLLFVLWLAVLLFVMWLAVMLFVLWVAVLLFVLWLAALLFVLWLAVLLFVL